MNLGLKKVLQEKWVYGIARNLPIWHSTLTLVGEMKNGSKYNLPALIQMRLHRGIHSDFYYKPTGRLSRQEFVNVLEKNLSKPSYIKFLKRLYPRDGSKLLKLAKELKLQHGSFKKFFDFYAYYISTLDITAMGSKVVTDRVLKMLADRPNQEEITAYFGQLKELPPVQQLQAEVTELFGKKINIEKEAERLYKKYCWIPINFVGEPWGKDYFVGLLKNKKIELPHLLPKPAVKLSQEEKYWLDLLRLMGELNEYRKSVFTRVSWQIRPVLQKLAMAHNLPGGWQDINFLTHNEILDLLNGRDDYQRGLLVGRQLCAVYTHARGSYEFLYSNEVLAFEKKFKPRSEGLNEVKGVVANRGKIRGMVKIVLGPADFNKFKKGDILIAKMTSVDFLPIMKRAGAFVTDEGGLACHAAIISREYGKPCIVGTGLGTAVFKDRDLVEVDAGQGVVKKIG